MKQAPIVLLAAWAALVGCARGESTAATSSASRTTATPAPRAAPAAEALDGLDPRAPVPLLPVMALHQKQNMRDHLVAVQQIVAAVAKSDFAAAESAARRLGSSESMHRMCTHMGAGAPGFTEQALAFHDSADRIATAARGQARDRILLELGSTLERCTACHAAWKQKVVDETTWQELTGAGAPHG